MIASTRDERWRVISGCGVQSLHKVYNGIPCAQNIEVEVNKMFTTENEVLYVPAFIHEKTSSLLTRQVYHVIVVAGKPGLIHPLT